MSKYKYSEQENEINNVLHYQRKELQSFIPLDMKCVNDRITESENLLNELGYSIIDLNSKSKQQEKKAIVIPKWEELCIDAKNSVGDGNTLESLFTKEELKNNEKYIKMLNNEYNSIHKLDKLDIMICASAGILGAVIDILLVGIPHKTVTGVEAGPLSNYVRNWFYNRYPEDEMNKLANSHICKVPYDAQDNRNTKIYVEGLSAYYHRLLSLGHDPLLGLIFGVFDILTGRMTTIDKNGKIVSQIMNNYADRSETNIFAAIAKQILHLKSDVTTSMGLPVPLMPLFNLLQFGSIGEANQTIAEIVQGMYFEGYDFIHFCSMSIPTMIIEVIVRIGYSVKRIKEGNSIKESIPVSLDREKNPKLATMLFMAHSISTAANAGKVYFSKNPNAINYTQWLLFTKYSYKQLKWCIMEKPELRDSYVRGILNEELVEVYTAIDELFNKENENTIVIL